MLSAKDAEVDIVVGLELGADDYVTKPYSSRELLARIKAVLRRRAQEPEPEGGVLEYHGISLDTDRHQLFVRGEAVSLPLKEFELLELLMSNAGRVLTRAKLSTGCGALTTLVIPKRWTSTSSDCDQK